MEEKYPYLGIKQIEDKSYVVLFTEEDRGVVVMNQTNSDKIKFGMIGNFDENEFELLPQTNVCVLTIKNAVKVTAFLFIH